MLLEIDLNLYKRLSSTLKDIDKNLYFEFMELIPLETDITKARAVKTRSTKQSIKKTIKELITLDLPLNRYQVHKRANIPYKTLAKYFDEVVNEIRA